MAMLSTGVITLPRSGPSANCYAGDDGALQTGAAWPITRFNDLGDGSVTDTLTGRMWVKDYHLMLTRAPGFDLAGTVDGAVCKPGAALNGQGPNEGPLPLLGGPKPTGHSTLT